MRTALRGHDGVNHRLLGEESVGFRPDGQLHGGPQCQLLFRTPHQQIFCARQKPGGSLCEQSVCPRRFLQVLNAFSFLPQIKDILKKNNIPILDIYDADFFDPSTQLPEKDGLTWFVIILSFFFLIIAFIPWILSMINHHKTD